MEDEADQFIIQLSDTDVEDSEDLDDDEAEDSRSGDDDGEREPLPHDDDDRFEIGFVPGLRRRRNGPDLHGTGVRCS